jgi:hypothetical protein
MIGQLLALNILRPLLHPNEDRMKLLSLLGSEISSGGAAEDCEALDQIPNRLDGIRLGAGHGSSLRAGLGTCTIAEGGGESISSPGGR